MNLNLNEANSRNDLILLEIEGLLNRLCRADHDHEQLLKELLVLGEAGLECLSPITIKMMVEQNNIKTSIMLLRRMLGEQS